MDESPSPTPETPYASTASGGAASSAKPLSKLRIWPPILLSLAIPVLRAVPSLVENGPPNLWMAAAFGPLICCLLIVLWWLLFSRASWKERLVGTLVLAAIGGLTALLCHESMMGPALIVLTIPIGLVAFAIGVTIFGRQLTRRRTTKALAVATLGFACSLFLRTEGMWGDFTAQLLWRWDASAEEQLIAKKASTEKVASSPEGAAESATNRISEDELANSVWPAFRGADRQGRVTGVRIEPWNETPRQVWKIDVGPGWSSFVTAGNRLFTQEQLGEEEMVTCYAADTGEQIWAQSILTRFSDSLGGPGPRATPTIGDGAIFTMGANGNLVRLDPNTGDIAWQVDVAEIAKTKPPQWGFSCSPLVTNGKVIVYAGGDGNFGLLAFDAASGELAWSVATGTGSYSSPQLCEIGGTIVAAILTNEGLSLLNPETGDEVFDYEWSVSDHRPLQPAILGADTFLIPTGEGVGTRKITFDTSGADWQVEEFWTSREMKTDFNDLVVRNGFAFGFNGQRAILTCIDLETGERMWRAKKKFGKGQIVLIADSDLLLVSSEYGDVSLVRAEPDGFDEVATFKAIEGKAWNHPVVIGNRLYIRSDREAACYEW